MKNYFRLLFVAIAMLFVQTALAQEKRNFRDAAFNYLMQNISSNKARPWSVKADHYDKLSNGGYLVKLTIARTLTRQEDRLVNNQVQAYGSTFNVGVRNAKVNINYEDTKSYFVFCDRNCKGRKYMVASTNHEFYTWDGNAWLIMNKHTEAVGNKQLTYYSNAACFSNEGETKWSGRDMKIFGWAFNGSTLYLVGTLWKNGCSIVRSIDIKTLESNDKVGNSGVIPSDIAFGEKGLTITQYASNGQVSDYILPYAASSRQVISEAKINRTDNSNNCWYMFGTIKEMEEQNIIKNNSLNPSGWNKHYFTKADIRNTRTIKLYSREATLMTTHPKDSYDLLKGDDGKYVLKINDPQSFWSHSKYLVIIAE